MRSISRAGARFGQLRRIGPLLACVGLLVLVLGQTVAASPDDAAWVQACYHADKKLDKTVGAPLFIDDFKTFPSGAPWCWLAGPSAGVRTEQPMGEWQLRVPVPLRSSATDPGANELVLCQEIPAGIPFVIETQVTFKPTQDYEAAGLVVAKADGTWDKNFVALVDAFCDTPSPVCAGASVYFDILKDGAFGHSNHVVTRGLPLPETIWLRIVRLYVTESQARWSHREPPDPNDQPLRDPHHRYEVYYAQYSKDGCNWITVGRHFYKLGTVRVGIIAGNAPVGATSAATAYFDYFGLARLSSTWQFHNSPPGRPSTLPRLLGCPDWGCSK